MKKLARTLIRRETGSWLLMVTALACLPWALRRQAPDAAFSLLLPAMLIGSTAAFVMCRPRLRGGRAGAVLAVAGALVLFARVGQLGQALGAAVLQSLRLGAALLLPEPNALAQHMVIPTWWDVLARMGAQAGAFAQRAAAWLTGILQGQVIDDPSSRALVIALGLWLLAVWAGGRLSIKADPLGSLLPITVALAFTLAQTVQDRWPLWLHLAALLVLLSGTHVSGLIRGWGSSRIDYSDSIAEDSLLSGAVLIVLVLSTAFAVSVFSLDDFLDKFRRQEPTTASASDSSGRAHPGSGVVRTGGAAGLQSAHLITAGPSLSQDVVMYIRTGDLPPMPPTVPIDPLHYYWRGQTYQRYNGHAWSNLSRTDVPLAESTSVLGTIPQDFRRVRVVVEAPGGVSGLAYWTGTLVEADLPLDVAWRLGSGGDPAVPAVNTPGNVDLIGALLPDNTGEPFLDKYAFEAVLPDVTEAQLQAAPQAYPAWVVRQYTQLPDSVPERVRALARDITVRGRTPYDRAVAIERYLRRIPYSLDVPAPPSSRDAADYFLFDLKTGYCDYYATAMTVLARAAGLPARLVTGYASGNYDSYAAEYVVREADAHSWTEVYFPGIGWIEFEPTASQPLPHRETVQAKSPATVAPRPAEPAWYVLPALDTTRLKMAWLAIPLLAALPAAWLLIDWLRLRWLPADAAVNAIYRRMLRSTRRLAGALTPGMTAREHGEAVTRQLSLLGAANRAARWLLQPLPAGVRELGDLYMRSLFAPTPLGSENARRAVRLWSGLRWRLLLVNVVVALRRSFAPPPGAPTAPAAPPPR